MALVGVLYLLFEKTILSSNGNDNNAQSASLDYSSKCIIGFQIGLIFLAMIVTKSSVSSLQAKQGLPLGNQVIGWIILGKHSTIVIRSLTDSFFKFSRSPCHFCTAFIRITTICTVSS